MPPDFDPYRRWLGILPEEQPPNHYRLLGLSLFEADPEVIEQAADRQISHIQRHKRGEWTAYCNTLLQELVAARLCLLQPGSKAAYDQQLRAGMARATPAVAPIAAPPPAGFAPPTVAAPAQPQPRPAPIPVRPVAAVQPVAVAPAMPVVDDSRVDVAGDDDLSTTMRRKHRARHKSNSNSLVVAGFVIAAGLCLCILGWAVMNASTTKPPAAAPITDTTTASRQPPKVDHEPAPAPAKTVPESRPDDSPPAEDVVVDLLALIQPDRDTVDGKWRKLRGKVAMLQAGSSGHARLQIPYHPPEEYQLDLTVTRQKQSEVDIGLVAGDAQVAAVIDGWDSKVSALNLVDDKSGPDGSTAHQGQVIKPGVATHISLIVKRDSITVSCNGQPIIAYSGSPGALGLAATFLVPDRRALFLAGHRKGYIVSRLQLTPISGSGEVALPSGPLLAIGQQRPAPPQGQVPIAQNPAGGRGPDEPAGEGPESGPVAPKAFVMPGRDGDPSGAVPGQNPRPPENLAEVPDEDQRQETLKLVRDVYADSYKQAKKPADKAALAERLLSEAAKSVNPLEQFVLFSEARSLAATGESPSLVVQTVQQLGARFRIPVDEMIAESLEQMNQEAVPANVRKEMAECLLPIADRQIDQNNYGIARRLLVLALAAAKKTNDKQLVKDITARAGDVTELRRSAESLKSAQTVLEAQPDDADANLIVGKSFCLSQGDWAAGLPHLAKGSDAGLREVANLESAGGTSAEEQIKIGDAWWALAENAKGGEPAQYQSRAAHWYTTALPALKGLSQTKVAKRLEELAAVAPKAKPVGTAAPAASTPAKPLDKMAGLPALKNLPQRIKLTTKKELLVRSRLGGAGTGLTYLDVSQSGLLVGFNFTYVERLSWGYIASIQPIYQTARGVETGQVYGIPLGDVRTVLAKKGFAVAGVNGALQNYLYGLEVIFNAVDAAGNLDPKESYRSDWQGTGSQYYRITIGDDGLSVIGIYGTGGDYLTGLGLVQLPKQ